MNRYRVYMPPGVDELVTEPGRHYYKREPGEEFALVWEHDLEFMLANGCEAHEDITAIDPPDHHVPNSATPTFSIRAHPYNHLATLLGMTPEDRMAKLSRQPKRKPVIEVQEVETPASS